MKRLRAGALAAVTAITLSGLGLAAPVAAVDLVSVAINGMTGNAASSGVASNLDGTVIAFYSDASDLVPGDNNGFRDVFVRDFNTGTTERVNLGPGGVQANANSHAAGGAPAINGDGTIVVFYSDAFNLVEDDTNDASDIFVYDRTTEELTRINLAPNGDQANADSLNPTINGSGRYVAYQSFANNLIDGDNNGFGDIFLYDRMTGITERICNDNVEPNGSSFVPAISPDGFFVAFATSATNLIADDTNGLVDVYVCNRFTDEYDRVSIGFRGQGNGISILPDISASGCFVAYKSEADNLVPDDRNQRVDVFVRNRGKAVTELISMAVEGGSANDASFPPTITNEGRFVAFGSSATDLLVGDVNHVPSVYVRDRHTWGIRLVDVNDAGQQADAGTPDVPTGISGDASQIGFVSGASNLTPPGVDRNFTNDIFIGANEFEPANGGNVCCECPGDSCVQATNGTCPEDCIPACESICDPGPPGNCVFIEVTPTPTTTPTGPTPTRTATPTGPTATATPTGPTATATPTGPTATATPTGPTATATASATPTGPTATSTPTGPTATSTPTGPTATATSTPTGPTATATSTPTGPTATATSTPTGPTATATSTPTGPTATSTPTGPTATSTPTGPTATSTPTGPTATSTPTGPTATSTPTGPTATSTPTGPTATATPTGPTPTFTMTGTRNTATPTRTGSPGPTAQRRFDDDSCAIATPSSGRTGSSNGALLLLVGPLALLVGRSRRR